MRLFAPAAICSNMTVSMTRSIDIEALCAEKGLRITEQRKVIARVLSRIRGSSRRRGAARARRRRSIPASRSPPSIAPSACSRRPGILDRHDFGDGRARYEAARRDPSRPSDRRRDRQGHRVRRRGARGAAAPDRREARLPPGRSPDGALRRRPQPRTIRSAADAPAICGWRPSVAGLLALRRRFTILWKLFGRALALAAASSSAMSARSAGLRVTHRGHAAQRPRPVRRQPCELARHPRHGRRDPRPVRRRATMSSTGRWSAGSPASTTRSSSPAHARRDVHGQADQLRARARRRPRGRPVPGRDDQRRRRAAAVPAEPVRLGLPAARPA